MLESIENLGLAFRLFESQGISAFVYEPGKTEIEKFDAGLRRDFFSNEDYGRIKNWIAKECSQIGNIYLLEDFLRLCMVVVPFFSQDGENADGNIKYFVASPFTFETSSPEDVKNLVREAGFTGEIEKPLYDYFMNLPQFGLNRDRFQSFLCSLFTSVFKGAEMHLIYHYFAKGNEFLYSGKDANAVDFERVAEVERRYMLENSMLEAVKNGDAQAAISAYKKIAQSGIKPRTPNALRNLKNFSIVLNSHLRKIMELQGVHPFYVDQVSRDFSIAIEQCTSSVQIFNLAAEMIKTYSRQTALHKIGKYSQSVRNAILYIDFHYADYISLQLIADQLHINASYLSAQFSKETGSTITAFINKTRIEHSLPLLKEKSRSIESIANTCGFDDMNYFARVFRKLQGMSPSQYRRSLDD